MTDREAREAFEAWRMERVRVAGENVPRWQTWGPGEEKIALAAWQAALATQSHAGDSAQLSPQGDQPAPPAQPAKQQSEQEKAKLDLLISGVFCMVDGKRVDPKDVSIDPPAQPAETTSFEACLGCLQPHKCAERGACRRGEAQPAELDEAAALVRRIHQLIKRGRDTDDHGLIGNLRCVLDHLSDARPSQPEGGK